MHQKPCDWSIPEFNWLHLKQSTLPFPSSRSTLRQWGYFFHRKHGSENNEFCPDLSTSSNRSNSIDCIGEFSVIDLLFKPIRVGSLVGYAERFLATLFLFACKSSRRIGGLHWLEWGLFLHSLHHQKHLSACSGTNARYHETRGPGS